MASPSTDSLERAKSYATICSAVAIPIALAFSGYFIQRSLADDGLKKDYVGIAAGILKENPANQEPELRTWAVQILDSNSPVPFSQKVKAGLKSGNIVVSGLPFVAAPKDCMIPPRPRTVSADFQKLVAKLPANDPNATIQMLGGFANSVMAQEISVLEDQARLACVQNFEKIGEEGDIKYRKAIGAISSVEEMAQAAARNKAKADRAAKSSAQPPIPPLPK
jgi:hypothetical protein